MMVEYVADAEEQEDYLAFLDKFKPKKTTDDCHTPEIVYEAVATWVSAEYGLDRRRFVRPFWPGADYESEVYPDGCVVVDNPPFSILTRICRFYDRKGVSYFLFAPGLTTLSGNVPNMCAVCAMCDVTYENGANVRTSFVTNLEPDLIARTAPELTEMVNTANKAQLALTRKQVPKYVYPREILTVARLGWMSIHGVDLRIRREDAKRISRLDAMRDVGVSGIFGGGVAP